MAGIEITKDWCKFKSWYVPANIFQNSFNMSGGGYITQGDQGALMSRCCLGSTIQTRAFAVLRSVRVLLWVSLCKDIFLHGHLGPPRPSSFKML